LSFPSGAQKLFRARNHGETTTSTMLFAI
jgi:hypothetical protein